MDFVETVTLSIPQIDNLTFQESVTAGGHNLIIEVAAIHEGLTSNFNHYSREVLENALDSWVSPYPKPIIMNHDPQSEPIGRIMAAKMDVEADGTPFTRLQVAVTDPKAIEKILSQRYLTGSVGGKAAEATCSVCNVDWSKATASAIPCKHRRGSTHKGKLAYLEMKNLTFKEYSFVNMPADGRSGVRPSSQNASAADERDAEEDAWVRPARIFDLNMNKEEVLEYTESESRNVLAGMRRKESAPLYLSLKGAFLSALAANESENEDTAVEEEEDLLAVSEGLSADLSASVDETMQDADASANDEAHHVHIYHKGKDPVHVIYGNYNEQPDADDDDDPNNQTDDTPVGPAPAANAADDDENDVVEAEVSSDMQNKDYVNNFDPRAKRAEGQAKAKAVDVDPFTSRGAPRPREDEEESGTVTETDSELNEVVETLESNLAEAEARVTSLLEENTRLKAALKRNLVERVVDTKIERGLVERSDRETEVTEHLERSAVSLADSLRDLAAMPAVRRSNYSDFPTVEGSLSVPDKREADKAFLEGEMPELEPEKPKHVVAEDLFVDALMGRRKL